MFPSWVMVHKLSKKVQFFSDLSKKSKSVKAIYINASEKSHYTLSDNGMAFVDPSHRSWDKNIKKDAIKISKISDYNIKKDAESEGI